VLSLTFFSDLLPGSFKRPHLSDRSDTATGQLMGLGYAMQEGKFPNLREVAVRDDGEGSRAVDQVALCAWQWGEMGLGCKLVRAVVKDPMHEWN
jgi:hypothetical protein